MTTLNPETGPYKSCKPPDSNPRKPNFRLPPGACDAHCHVFGPGNLFPYHPGRSYTPPDAPRQTLKNLHDFLGIDRAVIVQASCHGPDNTAMLDAIAHNHNNYRGVCHIDENTSEKDLQKLHDGGVRGVRFNFVKHLKTLLGTSQLMTRYFTKKNQLQLLLEPVEERKKHSHANRL